jgi:hypothetical protein
VSVLPAAAAAGASDSVHSDAVPLDADSASAHVSLNVSAGGEDTGGVVVLLSNEAAAAASSQAVELRPMLSETVREEDDEHALQRQRSSRPEMATAIDSLALALSGDDVVTPPDNDATDNTKQ